mmetsp:Transcript_127403/g.248216  ORF Transcript_127403/g.248216 Transcript_127403/m.248216 type:complete len:106 (-) Transcript_127403:372-689(-)
MVVVVSMYVAGEVAVVVFVAEASKALVRFLFCAIAVVVPRVVFTVIVLFSKVLKSTAVGIATFFVGAEEIGNSGVLVAGSKNIGMEVRGTLKDVVNESLKGCPLA